MLIGVVGLKMTGKDTDLKKNLLHDFKSAQEKFKAFEFTYRVLLPGDLMYLRKQSATYKKAVKEIQKLILPAVRKHCPHCRYGTCCRLNTPELSIYIAGTIGCFNLTDYLLVRCDTELPAPDFANGRRNLCPFWDNGCRLQPDCRSLLCLRFFCEPIGQDLNMDLVNEHIAAAKSVVDNFSLGRLLQKQSRRY
jgi:hypothetical protein